MLSILISKRVSNKSSVNNKKFINLLLNLVLLKLKSFIPKENIL